MNRREHGFSLIEVAIVLLVLGILLGGMSMPLRMHQELRQVRAAQTQLQHTVGVLLSFAVVYGRLPCSAHEPDPHAINYGLEDCAVGDMQGYLPWRTLGLAETDPWGTPRTTPAEPWYGHLRYRPDANFTQLFTLQTRSANRLQVVQADGRTLTASSEPPVVVLYSTGPNRRPDGINTNPATRYQSGIRTATFDDLTIWISRLALFERMIRTRRLP